MGIIEHELAAFSLTTGTEVRIELNKGDVIHVHIGEIRLDLTPQEFEHFSSVLKEGKESVEHIKHE